MTIGAKRYRPAKAKGRQISTWGARIQMSKITGGSLGGAQHAWIYVGTAPDGRIKVGMSSQPEKRGRALGVAICHMKQVRPETAKQVETEVLRILGAEQCDTEWVKSHSVSDVIKAVESAFTNMRRTLWVDPLITEEEARSLRVNLAVPNDLVDCITSIPDKFRLPLRRGIGKNNA